MNPQFLGPQDPEALALKILQSKGPSGENREYLYNLEEALLGLSEESEDRHISDLAGRCRGLEGRGIVVTKMGDGNREVWEDVEK
jgi:cation transport protein ChaC